MYDFHKEKCKESANTFSHSLFKRGGKKLIEKIKRKIVNIEESNEPEVLDEKNSAGIANAIQELNQRLVKLETKNKDYDKLSRKYNEMKERNKYLENTIMYLTSPRIRNGSNLSMLDRRQSPSPGRFYGYGTPYNSTQYNNTPMQNFTPFPIGHFQNNSAPSMNLPQNERPNIAPVGMYKGPQVTSSTEAVRDALDFSFIERPCKKSPLRTDPQNPELVCHQRNTERNLPHYSSPRFSPTMMQLTSPINKPIREDMLVNAENQGEKTIIDSRLDQQKKPNNVQSNGEESTRDKSLGVIESSTKRLNTYIKTNGASNNEKPISK